MNPKEIGAFLKQLRKEKGITQEQLAEIVGVSGRTVSRWETGSNLPDLSILVQLSEYYDVEMKEILGGERKSDKMDKELKETILKVADYSELEKQKAAQVGRISFSIMFLACAVTIVVQMLMTGNLSLVVGETIILVAGGFVYIFFLVKNGLWNAAQSNRTSEKDLVVSILCAGIFSIIFYLLYQEETETLPAVGMAICFFLIFSAVSYAFLRVLSYFSQKRADKLKDR